MSAAPTRCTRSFGDDIGSGFGALGGDALASEDLVRHGPELPRFVLNLLVLPVVLRPRDVVRKAAVALRDLDLVSDLFAEGDRLHEVVDGLAFVRGPPRAGGRDFSESAERGREVRLAPNLPEEIDGLLDVGAGLFE